MTEMLFTTAVPAAIAPLDRAASEQHYLRLVIAAKGYNVTVRDAYRRTEPDEYSAWDKALDGGRSYLVGDKVPMEQFIRDHRSPLTAWQKLAFDWVTANPDKMLALERETPPMSWRIFRRGEYVNFSLPHQDAGGEKDYISRDGRTKIQINED